VTEKDQYACLNHFAHAVYLVQSENLPNSNADARAYDVLTPHLGSGSSLPYFILHVRL